MLRRRLSVVHGRFSDTRTLERRPCGRFLCWRWRLLELPPRGLSQVYHHPLRKTSCIRTTVYSRKLKMPLNCILNSCEVPIHIHITLCPFSYLKRECNRVLTVCLTLQRLCIIRTYGKQNRVENKSIPGRSLYIVQSWTKSLKYFLSEIWGVAIK